ncbi:hypothetical protein CEP49_02955 [Mergibacter septicus]|uniref:hypothetical protein n=1 Tax=Mergibacter septicus TaxID=221402 RepID=UPI001179300B|nr:hypothetical protein [Mergibacter septicus]AWX13583.1 hypothetical protein CEP49_02955 [Mergibacter septicus]
MASDATGGTAIGERSRVFAGNSVAIRNRTEASNQGTVAYGYNAKAVGKSSIAIGANVAAAAQFDTSQSAKLVEYYNQLNTSLNGTNDDVAINAFDDGLKTVLDNGLPLTTEGEAYLTIGNDNIKKLATSDSGVTAKQAENAVVIGNKSFAVKKNSLAVGYATLADADNSFALGSYTYVSSGGINSIGLGVGSYVTGKNAFAGGTSATVKANNSIALGEKSLVGEGSGSSNAIGVNAKVLSSKSTALGTDVKIAIDSDNSIVLGNESKLGGGSGHSVIIGDNASIAKDSILDRNNKEVSPYAIAIGQSATIGANSGNSIAIGASASIAAGTTCSIALGNEFVPVDTGTGEPIKEAAPVPKYLVKIGVKNPDAENAEVNISMKGNDGTTSQPKNLKLLGSEMVLGNVANGTIDSNSKDAINGSQLEDLSSKLGTVLLKGEQGFTQPDFVALKQANGTTQDKAITLLNILKMLKEMGLSRLHLKINLFSIKFQVEVISQN